MADKLAFGAIPLHALADRNLSALHLRALGIISYHDRMSRAGSNSGKGQGCTASSKTMAQELDCNQSNLSTAINELVERGYVVVDRPKTGDRRRRIYRVVFEASAVSAGMDSLPAGQMIVDGDCLPQGQMNGADALPSGQTTVRGPDDRRVSTDCHPPDRRDSLPRGNETAEIVCPDLSARPQKTANPDPQYILQSRERYSAEAGRYSAEAARLVTREAIQRAPRSNVGGMLAQWEREIRDDPDGCREMGYGQMLEAKRDQCATSNQLTGWIDRLIAMLENASESPPAWVFDGRVAGEPLPVSDEPRQCERCGSNFEASRSNGAHAKRFCGEKCPKAAEKARSRIRNQAEGKPPPTDWTLPADKVLESKLAAGGVIAMRWASTPREAAIAKIEKEKCRRAREQQQLARRQA